KVARIGRFGEHRPMKRLLLALGLVGCGTAAPASPPPPSEAAPAPTVIAEPVTVDAGDAEDAATITPHDGFLGTDDAPLLAVLASSEITRIERGSGGRSLAFRLTFQDGSRGYFKPPQTFSGSHFYAEIASY